MHFIQENKNLTAPEKKTKPLMLFIFLTGSIILLAINFGFGLFALGILALASFGIAALKTPIQQVDPKVRIKPSKSSRETIAPPRPSTSTTPPKPSRSFEQQRPSKQSDRALGNASSESSPSSETLKIPIEEKNNTTETQRREESKQKESDLQIPLQTLRQSDKSQNPIDDELVSMGEPENGSRGFKLPEPPIPYKPITWIPYGRETQIQDLIIPGGLIYVGNQESSHATFQPCNDPAFIDTSKPIARQYENSENQMAYWTGYSQISPAARRAYLDWLAKGRRDPDTNIGCVFLFFYGLERRVFLDNGFSEVAEHEANIIIDEVKSLLAIYGEQNNSFFRYASALLEWISFRTIPTKLYEQPLPSLSRSNTLPLHIRIALGQAAMDRVKVPSHLALEWILLDQNISLRTPAKRCQKEFTQLFLAKYKEMAKGGILLPRNKSNLEIEYIPASPGIRGHVTLKRLFENIPDVSVLSRPTKILQEIVNAATTPLEEFSRLIGKKPHAKDTLEGLVRLPFILWPERAQHTLLSLKESLGDEFKTLRLWDIAERISTDIALNETKLTREGIFCLLKVLRLLDIGFEPNALGLVGLKTPRLEDQVVVFSILTSEDEKPISEEYEIRNLTLQLASAYAQIAKSGFTEHQIHYLAETILSWPHLTTSQTRRLQAYLQHLTDNTVALKSLKNKLQRFSIDVRQNIGEFIIYLCLSDRVPIMAEIEALEMIYQALHLEPAKVHSDLHIATSSLNLEMITSNERELSRISLDKDKIDKIKAEDNWTQALLLDIFNGDEEVNPISTVNSEAGIDSKGDNVPQEESNPGTMMSLLGLDEVSSNLVRRMLARNEWSREELQALANELGLMPDGAIEHINDASYNFHGIPFCEGDDPIVLNSEMTAKLTK
jgi:hypothetical protein